MGCSSLTVCVKGKSCLKKDSPLVFKRLKKLVEKTDMDDIFKVKKSDCFGLCKHGPIVKLDGFSYGGVGKDDCVEILKRHSKKREPIKRLLLKKHK